MIPINIVEVTDIADIEPALNLWDVEDVPDDMESARSNFIKSQKEGYKLYKAVAGDELIGTIGIRPFHDMFDTLPCYFLNNLVVKKSYRKQGVAKQLVDYIKSFLKHGQRLVLLVEPEIKQLYSNTNFKNGGMDFMVYTEGEK